MSPMYYAVFYDVEKPMDIYNAMQKRIDQKLFANLTDGIMIKGVQLKDANGVVSHFNVVSTKTFCITNSLDNTSFVICEVEKAIDFSKVNQPK